MKTRETDNKETQKETREKSISKRFEKFDVTERKSFLSALMAFSPE